MEMIVFNVSDEYASVYEQNPEAVFWVLIPVPRGSGARL